MTKGEGLAMTAWSAPTLSLRGMKCRSNLGEGTEGGIMRLLRFARNDKGALMEGAHRGPADEKKDEAPIYRGLILTSRFWMVQFA